MLLKSPLAGGLENLKAERIYGKRDNFPLPAASGLKAT